MVKWSLPAKRDLKAIYDYISKDSKFYAKRVVEEIIERSEILDKFPRMGRVVAEIGAENIRELIVYSYRLIYEISSDGIEILGLIHGRQDFPLNKLKKS